MGFLQVDSTRDKMGRRVLTIVARNLHPSMCSLERLGKYFQAKTDGVASEPYSIVWVHTLSTYWKNCPSLSWLWRTYERCVRACGSTRLRGVHVHRGPSQA